VAEYGGGRIQKLTITGKFLMKIGSRGSGNGQLYHPWGMCLASDGKLYVAEYSAVQIFNPDAHSSV